MFPKLSTILLSCIAVAAAAEDVTPFVGAHGAITPGSYIGVAAQLDIWPDQTFHFRSGDLAYAGKWYADPALNGIVLDLEDRTAVFEVRNAQRLRPVGAADDGAQDLAVSETFSPAPINLPLSGMFTYFADAATIVHCATGRTYPVAQDADYLALERAYLERQSGPAEPLFVTMDARIETREQMEGPDRLTVVPASFGGAFPGEDCSLGHNALDLPDAVWTITALGDVTLDSGIVSQEPFLTFREGEDGFFFASVGCNMLRGRFARSGTGLSFVQPVASTMMACPDPVADWETRLGDVLPRVSSYKIGGRTLMLLDADGAEIAALRAVYLP